MAAMTSSTYCGRFAPSPTGPLHFGSLVAALGSCLEARARGGQWLLRIEDVDEPRCPRGAAAEMLATLESCGFAWDGAVVWQSERKQRYADLLDQLKRDGRAYPCACTRRELADSALAIDGALVYPGTCRDGLPPGRAARAWRLRVDGAEDGAVGFDDAIQGRIEQHLARDIGDFVLRRADGWFAYQLAVVADDADAGITHVVRGADLLDSTPRQIFLQRCLGFPTPAYAHLPVAVNAQGEKLSKQTLAPPIDAVSPAPTLWAALRFLGQLPPSELARAGVAEIWRWALAHWNMARVPRRRVASADFYAE
jgi:glutamyl-Q tRNA(Asp) synthetase